MCRAGVSNLFDCRAKQTILKRLRVELTNSLPPWCPSVPYTKGMLARTVARTNNNNNDRLTAFDPGQPG